MLLLVKENNAEIMPLVIQRMQFSLTRTTDKGFYWDEKGIVIDLNGTMVYWDEIEKIKLVKARGGKSTVIYPHYTNHEKIRARRNKWMPTTAHSIAWVLIESPNEYHENLMKTWEAKNNVKKIS